MSFSEQEMSSSEQETVPIFRSADLPLVRIPSPFASSIESSDSCLSQAVTKDDCVFKVPNTRTDVIPSSTSPTELRSTFSQFALSSQTSEDSDNSIKVPSSSLRGKRRVKKVNVGKFRKGEGLKRKSVFTPLPAKRLPTKPTSGLFKQVKFPPPNKFISIKLRKEETHLFRDLLISHGSQIIDMDLLSMVFSLLRCTEPKCTGPLKLYQYAFRDGLQSYLLLKCSYCHLVIAQFPTSLPIDMQPTEAVNDPQMLSRRKSEVNVRALLAVHCTSLSWNDFLLSCNLLGIQNTWKRMNKVSLLKLVESANTICQQSMSMSAKLVRDTADTSNIPDCKNCTVSYDGSWHQRGHYSNQGFAAAIEVYSGKVLDYVIYERVCSKCLKWTEERKKDDPDEYSEYWKKHSGECPAN